MTGREKEYNWVIIPEATPEFIYHCSKCNKKMNFYCSEKFRLNGNHKKIDIWLIYKCVKCDTTWKLEIYKGIKPDSIPAEMFERFINNDRETAWKYAFDTNFIQSNSCVPDYSGVGYTVIWYDAKTGEKVDKDISLNQNITVNLLSPYKFELKLSGLLAKELNVSLKELYALAESGRIEFDKPLKLKKYRIRNDLKIYLHFPQLVTDLSQYPF